jgi:hypothetical protein
MFLKNGPGACGLDSEGLFRPRRGAESTSQAHARTVFKRALQHENLLVAEATAREIGDVSLAEALELTALIAEKEPSRHGPFAVRWLARYLQEQDPTIDEIALVVGSLVALPGPGRRAALSALRDLT